MTVTVERDVCAACGHSRVFHQIGTGNGVPLGKEFCDDRHADPCSCTGFVERAREAHADDVHRMSADLQQRERTSLLDMWRQGKPAEVIGAIVDWLIALENAAEPRARTAVTYAPRDLTATGTWRVCFHRLNPEGLPWCIAPDAGGWEIAVRSVDIEAPSRAVYEPKPTPDDEDGRPSAWIAAAGTLTVGADGRATIQGSERST